MDPLNVLSNAEAKRRGKLLGANGRSLAARNRKAADEFAASLKTKLDADIEGRSYSEIARQLNASGVLTISAMRQGNPMPTLRPDIPCASLPERSLKSDSERMSVVGRTTEDICSQRVFRSLTQMYGPAVRCKSLCRTGGKRSCINVSGL